MKSRTYTILIVPDRHAPTRRIVLPSWVIHGASIVCGFLMMIACMMFLDYWFVMGQIGENRELKQENRDLRQQVQAFQNHVDAIEETLDRMKNFSTRLKIIMHIDTQSIPMTAPQAAPNDDARLEIPSPEQLQQRLALMLSTSQKAEATLQDVYEVLSDKQSFLAALPTRQPAEGYFTSGFGVRSSPLGGRIKMHEGVDIANRPGTPVHAPADGEVIYASAKPGYGLTIIINHGYGIETWYGHLRGFAVKLGEQVKRGTKIATLGNSGRSTGPHVHYEVRVHGYPVDPRSYIFEDALHEN